MRKPVILCIDDESVVLTSLKEQLKKKIHEFDIETADSGEEALEIIEEMKEEKVDVVLVISDYIMPRMKGDEVLSKIHEQLPAAIKILLTGQATMEGVVNSLNNANLYRYISKPWEEEDLILTVNEGIKSYNKDRQLESQNKALEDYNRELVSFTDAMVEALVAAIDTRDTTTAGHSKRLAQYAVKLAEAVNEADYGKYKDFKFTEQQIKELYYAALLHDVGKIGINEKILQKEFRLPKENLNEIKSRFAYVKKSLELKKFKGQISIEELETLEDLSDNLEFVAEISKRSRITEEEKEKIEKISEIQYVNEENIKLQLLRDEEVDNLVVKFGNLTASEREIINSHVEYTFNILKKIPWTKGLKAVPQIASSHHERLDGTGYNLGSNGDELTVQTRILSILDVFEALTALDRPYKPPMSAEKALQIIKSEVEAGKFDRDIFEIIVKEKIYEK